MRSKRFVKVNDDGVEFPFNVQDYFKNLATPVSSITPETLAAHNIFEVFSPVVQVENAWQRASFKNSVAYVNDRWEVEYEVTQLTNAELSEKLKTLFVNFAQSRLDNFAKTRNYDNILSAATYATSTIPKFAAEGQRAVELRDATWAALYQILADVQAGTRPTPTSFADIEPDLPELTWTN